MFYNEVYTEYFTVSHLDISLLAFISLIKENEAFQESDKKWLSNFVSDETPNSLINQVEINANSQKIF